VTEQWIKFVRDQYEPDAGFLWHLRQGTYDESSADQFFEGLRAIRFEERLVDRELVALLWELTWFVWTQVERAEHLAVNQEQFRSVLDRVVDILASEKRLGFVIEDVV
jgi:hypothetical protein